MHTKKNIQKLEDLRGDARFIVTPCPLHESILVQYEHCKAFKCDIRLVTYNLLLDAFCDNDWACTNLYQFCPKQFLRLDYRKSIFLRQLLVYAADIYCLQEVGCDVFQDFLQPHLFQNSMSGCYANKISKQPFGSAVFYKNSKFELVEHIVLDLTKIWESHATAARLNADPYFVSQISSTTTSAQILLLRSIHGHKLCVCNTHLFSHPSAPHIRSLQAAFIINTVEEKWPHTAVLFAGDLNSTRSNSCISFLSSGLLSDSDIEWSEGAALADFKKDTQQERQANWHAVMREDDIDVARYVFCTLDSRQEGFIDVSAVLALFNGQKDCEQVLDLFLKQAAEGKTDRSTFLNYSTFFRALSNLKSIYMDSFLEFSKKISHDAGLVKRYPVIVYEETGGKPLYANASLSHSLHLKRARLGYYFYSIGD